ncbi:PAS domain-containing sensor histidine kinase [Salinigranum salinum]|uniref:PAS domain-containing sensor histidine kinase n=1 Tax=Salinigranum salinum TaxID=1364937 RepID=UPI001260DCE7|nr:PAS domain S-box protein [Salinigranum salinum]
MDRTAFEETLLDHTIDIIVVLDETGEFQYANAAVRRVLGYDPEELIGRNALDLIHPDDRSEVVGVFRHLVDWEPDADQPAADWSEFRYRGADGEWVWLAARMSSEPSSRSGGYVVSCRDIDAQRRAEREHRRTHERLLHIAEHTNDVLWMFSADWEELLFINSAYEELWGRSIEALEADATDFLEGVHPADRDAVQQAMACISSGESIGTTYRVNAATGFGTWVWVQGHPIVEDGTVTRVVGFARDVTERRERERQLLVMDRLLRHNLRNEMNLILGHAEQARDRGGEAVASDVDRIVQTGEHLLRTVDKERDIVALLTDAEEPGAVDLVSMVEDICARVREAHPRATVEATLPAAATVRAVPKLSLAVYELLVNAIEHADSDAPRVELTVRVDDDRVDLVVADDCPPIPVQEIRVLRGERDVRSVYHGSGLGLWLVYWAVDRSDGELAFETATDAGRGNTITVSLDRLTG